MIWETYGDVNLYFKTFFYARKFKIKPKRNIMIRTIILYKYKTKRYYNKSNIQGDATVGIH